MEPATYLIKSAWAPGAPITPVGPLELGTSAATMTAFPWLLSRLSSNPLSVGEAARTAFGAPGLASNALFEILRAPLNDPGWQAGEKHYLESIGSGLRHGIKQIEDAGVEARKRYGLLGVPVQAMHGILNPVGSTLYGVKALRDRLLGKEGQALRKEAELKVRASLEASHAI